MQELPPDGDGGFLALGTGDSLFVKVSGNTGLTGYSVPLSLNAIVIHTKE